MNIGDYCADKWINPFFSRIQDFNELYRQESMESIQLLRINESSEFKIRADPEEIPDQIITLPSKKRSIIPIVPDCLTVRVAHLVAAIINFVTHGIDLFIGVFPAVLALGNACISTISWKLIPFSDKTFFGAQRFLRGSATLLPRCYEHALKFFHPNAKFPEKSYVQLTIPQKNFSSTSSKAWWVKQGNGFFTNSVIDQSQYEAGELKLHRLQVAAINHLNNKNFLMSRVNYLGLAILLIITRTLDAIVGGIAVPLSFIALFWGGSGTLNNTAYRGLQAPAVINDLFYCAVKFLDPFAGTNYQYKLKSTVEEISYRDFANRGTSYYKYYDENDPEFLDD